MEEQWEESKSLRQNLKYRTGHTYKRLSSRTAIRLNCDNCITNSNDVVHDRYGGRKCMAISINKNKNWILKDNYELFDDRVEIEDLKSISRKKKNEKKVVGQIRKPLEPILTLKKEKKLNKLIYEYTFVEREELNDEKEKIKNETKVRLSTAALNKPNKCISRRALCKLERENKNNEMSNNHFKNSTTVSFEVPLMNLKKGGKCWKRIDNWSTAEDLNYKYPSTIFDFRKAKNHKIEKHLLAIEDRACATKKRVQEYAQVEQVMHFLLKKNGNDNLTNCYKPPFGQISFTNKSNIIKHLTKNPLTMSADDDNGFYICTSDDWQSQNPICKICNDQTNDLFKIDECQHSACRDCLVKYVQKIINSFFSFNNNGLTKENKIVCIHANCKSTLDMSILTRILSSTDLNRYVTFYCDSTIRRNKLLTKCDREGCKNLIVKIKESQISTCECNYMICSKCCMEAHFPLDCHRAKLNYSLFVRHNRPFENYFIQGKECPNCGMFSVKEGGCNHVQCICKHEFCWQCLHNSTGSHRCMISKQTTLKTYSLFNLTETIDRKLLDNLSYNSKESSNCALDKKMRRINNFLCKLKSLNYIDTMQLYDDDDERVDLAASVYDLTTVTDLLYAFFRRMTLDMDQYNTFCKYAAFEVIFNDKCKFRGGLKTILKLCQSINAILGDLNNWRQVNSLIVKYRQLRRALDVIRNYVNI